MRAAYRIALADPEIAMCANTQKFLLATLIAWSVMAAGPRAANAQDLLQYFDLTSDEFTKADMTRAEIEAADRKSVV